MQGAGRSSLRLHHVDVDNLAEDVGLAASRPAVHVLTHGRGRRDRIDEGDVRHGVGDVGCRLVAVHHLPVVLTAGPQLRSVKSVSIFHHAMRNKGDP